MRLKNHIVTNKAEDKGVFLAFMFCFLISDRVRLPQRTVSSKFSPTHVHMYAKFLKTQKVKSLENIVVCFGKTKLTSSGILLEGSC